MHDDLPERTQRSLGLVIDLDTCVGCHACVVACKEWNTTSGSFAPLSDKDPYGPAPEGAFLNHVHSFEAVPEVGQARVVHFPKSCLHCADAPCVTVCPTGASFKRAEDGIVLVNEEDCIGCGLCAWACPYGAREMDPAQGVMKKCTLCVDRIDNPHIPGDRPHPGLRAGRARPAPAISATSLTPASPVSRLVAERGGFDLMPEQGTRPTNKYLPPRDRDVDVLAPLLDPLPAAEGGFLGWLDRTLARL